MQKLKQPNKIRVPMSELEDIRQSDGGYDFYHYKGKPFNGYLVMDYHPNGYVMFEEEYKEGEHEGWDNQYYENGNLKEETFMYGETPLEYYEYDENGNMIDGGKVVSEEDYKHLVEKYNLLDDES